MIGDEDEDHVLHKDIPESQDDEFVRSVGVRGAAHRAFISVDTDQRLDLESPETPGDLAQTSDDHHDEQTTADPVPHSASSHWEWRPEYKVPPPEPDVPLMTRRRVVAKRPPTAAEEDFQQKRMKSESVPELFPLIGVECSEDVFEILIDLFASSGSERRQDSRGSEHRQDSRVPEAYVYTQDRDRAGPLKRRVEVSLRTLTREDRGAFTGAKQKEWASWLDKEAVELVKGRKKVPRSHIPRACWVLRWNNVETEKVPKVDCAHLDFRTRV